MRLLTIRWGCKYSVGVSVHWRHLDRDVADRRRRRLTLTSTSLPTRDALNPGLRSGHGCLTSGTAVDLNNCEESTNEKSPNRRYEEKLDCQIDASPPQALRDREHSSR